MLANRLNSAALPSITGNAAPGPMLPSPSTAEPSVTTATRPTTAGSTSVCSRIVIEYDALVAARRFFSLAMHASCPHSRVTGESASRGDEDHQQTIGWPSHPRPTLGQ